MLGVKNYKYHHHAVFSNHFSASLVHAVTFLFKNTLYLLSLVRVRILYIYTYTHTLTHTCALTYINVRKFYTN